MAQHSKYIELLEAILKNAESLKLAGSELLKAGIKNEELRPFAQFMLYCCIEECGKFLLVKDHYPASLSKQMLKKIGFENHQAKIKRVVQNMAIEFGKLHPNRNPNQIARVIRRRLREEALYVDYYNKNPLMPAFVKSNQQLNRLVSIVKNLLEFCKLELYKFKKTPVLRKRNI